ncbi:histidine--tRNA ligase [Methanobacterium spitsbergense]|uniref:Histidine--tRNA ligase n=1 Tax=Methanobacterium spitsbergense TaxID=2874285 RepID=A0A8T5V2G9_9EURY|nr:histidine--tRNA ligase [Methanobacterium spitsbergense]MBZ2166061.1 histidine--tRNA ligase [Methanobacterium spitsbergense]
MEIQRPRGTRDFLFKEMKERKSVETTMRRIFETYGYSEIKTPIFEELSLFTTKSGEGIKDQIYHFQDKGGRDLALRPELTAPVARMYIKELQKTPKPVKMYYFGSCFRYERPQKGRWRQFWQFGCELIGGKSPGSEAEVISMAAHCLEELGLKNFDIHIGNLGILRNILIDANILGKLQDQVMGIIDKGDIEELEKLLQDIDLDSDSKELLMKLIVMKGDSSIIKDVESLINCNEHACNALSELEKLLESLKAFGFSNYVVNLGIARGLDYYTGTVFEIYVHGLGAQKQISGGGTYNLIELFGGENVESTGFAFGFDRVMDALNKQEKSIEIERSVKVFVAPIKNDLKLKAFDIAQKLRKNGIPTDVDLVGKKLKKILSFADSMGINYVVLVGARDIEEGNVTVKDMTSGEQEIIDLEDIIDTLKSKLMI